MPEPRPTISLVRRLETAREWYDIFIKAAMFWMREGYTEIATRYDNTAAAWQKRIEKLETEQAAPAVTDARDVP